MDVGKLGIKRLTYDNYETWTLRARQFLTREKLWSYVCAETPLKNRTAEWKINDELALQTIGFLLEDPQLRIIKDAETAWEAWILLKNYYVKESSVGKVALIKKLSKLELHEGGDMRQHLIGFEALFERIENVGCNVDEDMKAAFILASLPQSYESIVSSIQGRMDVFTMNFVKTKLLEEFERRQERDVDYDDRKAMAVKVGYKQSKEMEGKRLCYACGSPNHLMRNCELLHKVRGEASTVSTTPKARSAVANKEGPGSGHGSVCFAAFEEEENAVWFLDSGASSHMTGRMDLLDNHEQMKERGVLLANGTVTSCDTKGEVIISAISGTGCSVAVSLKDVIVVPGLSANLVSVQVVTSKGFTVVFGSNDCRIMKDNKIIVTGKKEGKLYRLSS